MWVRAIHTKGVTHKQACTRLGSVGIEKLPLTLPHQGGKGRGRGGGDRTQGLQI